MSLFAVDLWLPPASLGLLALLALLLLPRRGRVVALVLLTPLVALSLPVVADTLLASLDVPEGTSTAPAPQAIVILSADVERAADAPADIGAMTLERERAGAILAKRTGLPVLVTGGLITAPPPLGEMMAASMPADFGVPVRWVEAKSDTTWENARLSVPMLKADGVSRAYLVTHAWHMRRSILAFERAGLDVVPAPVRRDPGPRWNFSDWVPRTSAWMHSYLALHEWAGFVQYRLRS